MRFVFGCAIFEVAVAEAPGSSERGRFLVRGGAGECGQVRDDEVSCEPIVVRILVVEENVRDHALLERLLSRMVRYEPQITLAGNLEAACFAASAGCFDIVIAGYSVGAGTGPRLVRGLVGAETGAPCIVVAGQLTPQVEADALRSGAAACLAKDELTTELLERTADRALRGERCDSGSEALRPFSSSLGSAESTDIQRHAIASPKGWSGPVVEERCVDLKPIVLEAVRTTVSGYRGMPPARTRTTCRSTFRSRKPRF